MLKGVPVLKNMQAKFCHFSKKKVTLQHAMQRKSMAYQQANAHFCHPCKALTMMSNVN